MSSIVPDGDPERARRRLFLASLAAVLPLTGLAALGYRFARQKTLSDLFFIGQDLPAFALIMLVVAAVRFLPARRLSSRFLDRAGASPRTSMVLALAVAALAATGWFAVFHARPYSMDEFMVAFDAAIFRTGALAARLPEAWRAFDYPLQPQFLIHAPGGAAWASIYLPVNALIRTGFGFLGAPWASGPALAGLSVLLVYDLARKFWPQRPDAAAVAAILLASSSQVLVTAMTPYAMTAHMAFNLMWLWLFLRPGAGFQGLAMLVAALACGLHQVVFHPLFAAPFVLHLWLARRWRQALAHTIAYLAIGLFWVSYWRFVLPGGGTGVGGAKDLGGELLILRLQAMLSALGPDALGQMAKNLFRFVVWQNPAAAPLALLGLGAMVKGDGVRRALVAGPLLTLAAVALLMPFQGHGWGYRYLHGFIGPFCLVAAAGWVRLTQALEAPRRAEVAGAVLLSSLAAVVVLLPLRAVQAEGLSAPYARAGEALATTPAEVVIVDPSGVFYGADLVRNDPFLRNRPKLINLEDMTGGQVDAICRQGPVGLFDRREAEVFGLNPNPGPAPAQVVGLRARMAALGCGDRLTPTPAQGPAQAR